MDDDRIAARCRWQAGSTTARDLGRLADALVVLQDAGLVGEAGATAGCRRAWTEAARAALEAAGLCRRGARKRSRKARDAAVDPGGPSDDKSAATKFLGGLEGYGFVRARLRGGCGLSGDEVRAWNATAGLVTPAGQRLAAARRARDAEAFQACCTAAMTLRVLPSPLEPRWAGAPTNPAGLVAAVLLELDAHGRGQAVLTAHEIGAYVQSADGDANPAQVASDILAVRDARTAAQDRRAFEGTELETARHATDRVVHPATVATYGDVTARHCHDTGIFERRKLGAGRHVLRLSDDPWARERARALAACRSPRTGLADPLGHMGRVEAGIAHWEALRPEAEIGLRPADGRKTAEMLRNLAAAHEAGLQAGREARMTATDEATLETERDLARQPWRIWPEVRRRLLDRQAGADLEARDPAAHQLLEWCLFWTMLLLVGPGGSATPPHVARRFPIAADLLPTAHAPGGGADVEMRLSSGLLLAGEATLLGDGQRQMSAEAEPVRLHVARLAQRLGEGRAIGLFVAPSLDLNLVQSLASGTFWIGAESVPSDVVPMTLAQLVRLGDAAVTGGGHPERIESVLRQCLERRGEGEVAWLQAIEAVLAGTSPATLVVREARPAVPRPPSRRTNPPKAPNGERPRTRQGDLFSVAA